MAKIFHKYDPHALQEGLQRIRDNADLGEVVQRPQFDPKARAEREAMARDGKDLEAFRLVLERHGFKWFPGRVVARKAAEAGTPMLVVPGEAAPEVEGQWRSRKLQMAFTPHDVAGGFLSPEALDGFLKRQELVNKLARGGVAKAERKIALARKS